ncbi:MAG: PhzF family phenazine biosynthesis isomerase, partial [Thermoplasmata archaeon]|nr:PhzF family phenazine biosynthesis isomerase [Thermoplasmata archaeon]
MATPVFVIDAFSDGEFTGNPAGVCLLAREAPRAWMQRVASEMKHSETAFVSPAPRGFRLRWFTPTIEVDLCGHATLAAAHVLWQTGVLESSRAARFSTSGGTLFATRRGTRIELDFPAVLCQKVPAPRKLVKGVGEPIDFVGRNRWDYLVEISSPARLRRLVPDLEAIASCGGRGVIV